MPLTRANRQNRERDHRYQSALLHPSPGAPAIVFQTCMFTPSCARPADAGWALSPSSAAAPRVAPAARKRAREAMPHGDREGRRRPRLSGASMVQVQAHIPNAIPRRIPAAAWWCIPQRVGRSARRATHRSTEKHYIRWAWARDCTAAQMGQSHLKDAGSSATTKTVACQSPAQQMPIARRLLATLAAKAPSQGFQHHIQLKTVIRAPALLWTVEPSTVYAGAHTYGLALHTRPLMGCMSMPAYVPNRPFACTMGP